MSELPDFTRDLAREIVRKALKRVADFRDTDDIEQFTFEDFQDYHKKKFLTALKLETNSVKSENKYYDIVLNQTSMDRWNTICDCIDYLEEHNLLVSDNTQNINFT